MDVSKDTASVESSTLAKTSSLEEQLRAERQRNAALTEENHRLRLQSAHALAEAEMEEEGVVNKLIRRLDTLKKEKADLALAIDQEEEFLTNTLQRKMMAIQREKVTVENQLEAEQEYLVNKLQKQMAQVLKDKSALEKSLEAEKEKLRAALKAAAEERTALEKRLEQEERHIQTPLESKLKAAQREKVDIEAACEAEQEFLVNKLQKQAESALVDKRALSAHLERLGPQLTGVIQQIFFGITRDTNTTSLPITVQQLQDSILDSVARILATRPAPEAKSPVRDSRPRTFSEASQNVKTSPLLSPKSFGKHQSDEVREELTRLRAEVKALRNENFVLQQRLQESREHSAALTSETSRLAAELESDSERLFNVQGREPLSMVSALSHLEGEPLVRGRAHSDASITSLSKRPEVLSLPTLRRYSTTSSSSQSLECLTLPPHPAARHLLTARLRGPSFVGADGASSTPNSPSLGSRNSPLPSPSARTPRHNSADPSISLACAMGTDTIASRFSQAYHTDEEEMRNAEATRSTASSRSLGRSGSAEARSAILGRLRGNSDACSSTNLDAESVSSVLAKSCDGQDMHQSFKRTLQGDHDDSDADLTVAMDSDRESAMGLSVKAAPSPFRAPFVAAKK